MALKNMSLSLKIFFIFVTIVFVSLGFLYVGLLNGIKVDQLSLSNFKISQFYLKLDKKIVFEMDKLEILEDNSSGLITPKFNDRTITLAQKILDKFQFIKIKNIIYNDFNGSFILDDKNIVLASNKIDANISYTNQDNQYNLKITNIHIKPFNIRLSGEMASNIQSQDINSSLQIAYKDLLIPLGLTKKEDKVQIEGKNGVTLDSLKIINDFTKLPPSLDEWLLKRLKSGKIEIKNYRVAYDTNQEMLLLQTLQANLVVHNIALAFHDKVDSVTAQNANVTIRNNQCDMKFENPILDHKSLAGSSASILEIFTKPALALRLKYADKLDSTIKNVLTAYGVVLPNITQTEGITSASMDLFLPFDERQMKIVVNGSATNSVYGMDEHKIIAKSLNFVYDKNVQLINSKISYGDINASVKNLFVRLDPKIITVDANVSLPIVGAMRVNGSSDLDLKTINAKVNIENFVYEKFLKVQNKQLSLYGDFKDEVHLVIPELNFIMDKVANEFTFEIPNITKIANLSPIAQEYKLSDGSIKATTNDLKNIDFEANIDVPELPVILYHKNREITKLALKGTKRGNSISVWDKQRCLELKQNDKTKVNLKNLLIKQKQELKKEQQEATLGATKKVSLYDRITQKLNLPNIEVVVEDSKVEDENNKVYLIDELNVVANKEDVEVNFKTGVTRLHLKKDDNLIELSGMKLNDEFINFMLDKRVLLGGTASIKASGTLEKISGFLNMYDVDMDNVPIVNNISKGYANFNFDTKKELLDIYKLNTTGSVVDLDGSAQINLKDSTIYSSLDVVLISTVADAIRQIPLIGYILFGNDAKVHVNTTVSGKLEDPKIETHFVKGTSQGVVNLLKRILLLPVTAVEMLGEGEKKE